MEHLATHFALGLTTLNLKPKESLCIFAETRAEWFVAAVGAFKNNYTSKSFILLKSLLTNCTYFINFMFLSRHVVLNFGGRRHRPWSQPDRGNRCTHVERTFAKISLNPPTNFARTTRDLHGTSTSPRNRRCFIVSRNHKYLPLQRNYTAWEKSY